MSEDERDMLHSSLVWDQDGCLTEIAQSAIIDGESALLPQQACEHAETCESCMHSIGLLAQQSLEIDSALKQLQPSYLPQRASQSGVRRPLRLRQWPLTELGLALVIALLGQLPTLQALRPSGIRNALKALVQVSLQVLQHVAGTPFGAALPWIATSMFVAVSGAIAYAARRGLARSLPLSSSPPRLR